MMLLTDPRTECRRATQRGFNTERRLATRRSVAKTGLLLVTIAAAGILGFEVLRPVPKAPPSPPPPVPVVAAPVRQRDVPIVLSGLGTVQALNTATVRSQVTGLLQTVNFVEGQQVHRGDVLAQIDPRPYQARLEQAQAQLARDQAQLADAQANLGRNLPLLRRGFATDQQVTDQKYQVAQLQSALKSDQAAIDDAQTQLSYTTLAAPFDGVTGVRMPACCMDPEFRRTRPSPVRGQAMRTEIGRPSSSLRLSA
jgi:membrane fusion protein, multidrug efflux system